MFLDATSVATFREFHELLETEDERPDLSDLGKRAFALLSHGGPELNKLHTRLLQMTEDRDYWHGHYRQLERNTAKLRAVKRFITRASPRRIRR
jgi:hypothetical protein